MSERASDIAPYESTDAEYRRDVATIIGASVAAVTALEDHARAVRRAVPSLRGPEPSEDEPESWTRSPRGPLPEAWRMAGRPFDPRQRTASRGEQRQRAGNAVLWTVSGFCVALAALWLVWSLIVG